MPARLPLLLIPGLLCDGALWQHQSKYLKDITDCTIAVTTGADSVAQMAANILQTAPPQFAVAGLSMGGYVALELMRQAPTRIIKLAIFNSSARPDTPEQRDRRRLLVIMSKTGDFRGVTPRLLPMLVHPDHTRDAMLTQIITTMAERVGRESFIHQQTAILNRIDSRPFLKNIDCPTLLVGGKQDAVTPPDLLQEIADGINNARLILIDQCGHLSALEQPAQVNALLEQWILA